MRAGLLGQGALPSPAYPQQCLLGTGNCHPAPKGTARVDRASQIMKMAMRMMLTIVMLLLRQKMMLMMMMMPMMMMALMMTTLSIVVLFLRKALLPEPWSRAGNA